MRQVLLLSAIGLALWCHAAQAAEVTAQRPSFVVILCDDLGYGDLSCQGHPVIKTPHLDKLAEQGMRLTQCYSASPVCSPSRAGLLTGKQPTRVGIYDWIPPGVPVHLPQRERTIASILREVGYQTCQVGKWHLNGQIAEGVGPSPRDHGFDHWLATSNNSLPSHENPNNFILNGKPVGQLQGYACNLVVDEALRWLAARDADKPFFLYVPLHEPHEPVASPPDLVAQYRPHARNEDEAQYFANVANLDAAVGRMVQYLDEQNLGESTLIFFSSDNGPEGLKSYQGAERSYGVAGPLRGRKLDLYEGGIRVPGILRWTGHIAPRQIRDEVVCSLDLLPTFAALAHVPLPHAKTLDGTNISGLLEGKSFERTRPIVWHYNWAKSPPKLAIRSGDWKLLAPVIGNSPKKWPRPIPSAAQIRFEKLLPGSLYQLANDIAEENDLSATEPAIYEQLSTELQQRWSLIEKDLID